MNVSRRNFIVNGTAAAVAASLVSKVSAQPLPTRSTKKGLAGSAPENSGLVTNWYYDWGLHPATSGMPVADSTIHFYPMCWGWRPAKLPQPNANNKPESARPTDNSSPEGLLNLKAQNPSILFGFNEPDQLKQSNLTVEAALQAWPSFQGVARELVGPSCAKPGGEWMAKFVPEIERQQLQLDSLGFHSYGSDSVQAFIDHLEAFHAQYKLPVWVTEFAVADWAAKDGKTVNRFSVERVAEFMKGACAYMEKTPWVRGYAWFPTGGQFAKQGKGPLASSVLFNTDGSMNDLGRLYNSI